MAVQGVLTPMPLLVIPFAIELNTALLFGTELLGALSVGAMLVAYLSMKTRSMAPPPEPPSPEPPEETRLSDEKDKGAEGATVPGAVTRTYAPHPSPKLEVVPEAAAEGRLSLLERMRSALGTSRAALQDRFDALLGKTVDASALDELEEVLLLADVGVDTATALVDDLRSALKEGVEGPALRARLKEGIRKHLDGVHQPLAEPDGLFVVLVVGVNGSGKTTSIGKLANRYHQQGKKVLLAAADTYRAAAADQLEVWSERAEVDLARLDEGADPGAVVYQAMERALAKDYDVVIIDTAGRLQTKKPLMEELSKIRRVIGKHVADAPHETLLVLDGTMGQNGLSQAALFNEATPLSGVVVTKLDGTAKGGMVLTIAAEMSLPVKLIGIGEGIDDLRDFDPAAFVEALA